ncbi:hypothetical protein NL108_018656 [Boleophthalmus pectinirostris]|nr:hypothetical protein NL108_014505 [Boleophthalmus pectinirostris]KAJ0064104.1 hypothetical protein NL108_018656 [Boleophthalmus pectinirostris]
MLTMSKLAIIVMIALLAMVCFPGFTKVPTEEVSVSVGDKPKLSFPLGECSAHHTWTIKKKTGDDVFTCRIVSSTSEKFEGDCPQEGQTYTVQMVSVERADLGEEYCLEIKQITCSCIHLIEKKDPGVDRADSAAGTKNNSTVISSTMWTFFIGLIVWGTVF